VELVHVRVAARDRARSRLHAVVVLVEQLGDGGVALDGDVADGDVHADALELGEVGGQALLEALAIHVVAGLRGAAVVEVVRGDEREERGGVALLERLLVRADDLVDRPVVGRVAHVRPREAVRATRGEREQDEERGERGAGRHARDSGPGAGTGQAEGGRGRDAPRRACPAAHPAG
jgi:hypothetical protein